jgi:hypothetical protein
MFYNSTSIRYFILILFFKPSIRATCVFCFPSKDMTTSLIVKGYSTKTICFFLLRVIAIVPLT